MAAPIQPPVVVSRLVGDHPPLIARTPREAADRRTAAGPSTAPAAAPVIQRSASASPQPSPRAPVPRDLTGWASSSSPIGAVGPTEAGRDSPLLTHPMGTLHAVEPDLMARHAVTPSQSANTPVAARPLSVARAVEVQRSQSRLAPALAPTPVSALAMASPAAGGRAWQTAPRAAMAPLAVLPPAALVPATVVQREDAAEVPSAAEVSAPQTPAAAEPRVAPEAAGTAALGAAGDAGQAQAGAAQAAGEPDELLKKLFDPLLRRLKAELRLDRERRGLLTDRWH